MEPQSPNMLLAQHQTMMNTEHFNLLENHHHHHGYYGSHPNNRNGMEWDASSQFYPPNELRYPQHHHSSPRTKENERWVTKHQSGSYGRFIRVGQEGHRGDCPLRLPYELAMQKPPGGFPWRGLTVVNLLCKIGRAHV